MLFRSEGLATKLQGSGGEQQATGATTAFAADERTNSLLIAGTPEAKLKYRGIIASLDAAQGESVAVKVVTLRYANARDMGEVLQAAATVHSGRMTQSTMMLDWVAQRSGRIRNLIEAGYMLIGAAMFALIVRATWPLLQRSIERQEFFGVPGLFTMPTWPIRLIMVIGSTAVVLVYLVKALDLVLVRSHAHNVRD